MDAHELVAKIKDLAIEMGKTPTSREFYSAVKSSESATRVIFSSYIGLIKAAGLEPNYNRHTKITDDIFKKDIESHLEQHIPKNVKQRSGPWPKIAVLGDMHEPFAREDVKSAFIKFIALKQPEYIVQVGDSRDQYSNASFPKSHNIFTPKDEETTSTDRLTKFWKEVHEAAPNAKKYLLLGNHCIRPLKRVLENLPSIEHWAEAYLKSIMTFDNVETIYDHRQELLISDIYFIHGYRSQLGQHRDYMQANVVCGHTHLGGVSFRQISGKTLFELNVGFCGDAEAKGLSYTAQKTVNWTLGWGWIDEWGPMFVPYVSK